MNGWPLSEVIRFVLQSFWKNPIIIIFMLITPLLLIFLSSTVLQEEAYEPTIGVEEISERMQASLLQQDVNVEQTSTAMALNKLSAGEMDAFFTLENQGGLLILEGANHTPITARISRSIKCTLIYQLMIVPLIHCIYTVHRKTTGTIISALA